MSIVSWTLSGPVQDRDKPILIDSADPAHFLTLNQLQTKIHRLVRGLQNIGVKQGDCVLVNSFHDIIYHVLYFGIIGAGARFTGVNPAYTAHELSHHMRLTKPKALLVEPQMLDVTLVAAKEHGIPHSRIFVFDIHAPIPEAHQSLSSWQVLLEHGEGDIVSVEDASRTVAVYASTSGTSGLPKAAMLPHAYLIDQADQRCRDTDLPYEVRRLCALPPFHVFALPIIAASIRQGHQTYIMRRYNEAEFIDDISRYQISETYMAPPIMVGIPKSSRATKQGLSSLRQIWYGGAAVPYASQKPLYDLMHPDAQINAVWGMTEVGWVTSGRWPEQLRDDSVARPLDGFDVRIVNDDDVVLEKEGAIGEIEIYAPHPMLGYIDNPAATREAFASDGWLRSGDIGYVDTDGRVHIVDRKKDLIKVRGWQVSPTEVETALVEHPSISDAAVIGIMLPDGSGEVPRAYVVRKLNAHDLTEAQVKAFCKQTISSYKVPHEVIFTDNIPKNGTGKILRRLLRETDTAGIERAEALLEKAEKVNEIERRPWPLKIVNWVKRAAKRPVGVLTGCFTG